MNSDYDLTLNDSKRDFKRVPMLAQMNRSSADIDSRIDSLIRSIDKLLEK